MSELRVNPAALQATSAALAGIAVAPPTWAVAPASAHPVSVAAAEQLNAVATNLASVMRYAQLLAARAAAAYAGAAADYHNTDAVQSHAVASARAALHTALGRPTAQPLPPGPPLVAPPVPPHPPAPALIPHPPDPLPTPQPADTAAAQLQAGDHGGSITALATVWRTAATTIDDYHQAVTAAADNMKTQWSGDAAAAAIDRLTPYATWFAGAAAAHRSAAAAADRVVAAHNRAVAEHPTVAQLATLKQQLVNATARAQTGNLAAVAEVERYRQQLIDAQTQSTAVTASYAGAAAVPTATIVAPPSPINPGAHTPAQQPGKPGNDAPQPRPGDTPDGSTPGKPPQGDGALADTLNSDGAKKLTDQTQPATTPPPPAPADPLESRAPAPVDEPLADPAAEAAPAMPAVMPMMAPLTQGLAQAAQPAAQMPAGQGLPSMPQMPTPPTSPMTPTPPELPVDPAGLGSGGAPVGGGGGGAGGGLPAAAPPTGLNAAAPVSSTPPPLAASAAGPAGSIGAGMPMGMMPHGGGKQGSEKPRPTDLTPDEPVYVEDRPNTEAFIDGTLGPQPPPEIKE
jgi:hypothetical protein